MWEPCAMDADRRQEVVLTYGEVVVLNDLLHRWEADGTMVGLPFAVHAERVAVWNLTAALEPLVNEVFDENYDVAVEDARRSLTP